MVYHGIFLAKNTVLSYPLPGAYVCRFADFGQCDHLTEREGSSWWSEHTRSFAMRQIDRYEREMGWAFWTWKLEDHLGESLPPPPPPYIPWDPYPTCSARGVGPLLLRTTHW